MNKHASIVGHFIVWAKPSPPGSTSYRRLSDPSIWSRRSNEEEIPALAIDRISACHPLVTILAELSIGFCKRRSLGNVTVLFSCVKFLKKLTNALGFVNIVLLHSNQRQWIDLVEDRDRWQAL